MLPSSLPDALAPAGAVMLGVAGVARSEAMFGTVVAVVASCVAAGWALASSAACSPPRASIQASAMAKNGGLQVLVATVSLDLGVVRGCRLLEPQAGRGV